MSVVKNENTCNLVVDDAVKITKHMECMKYAVISFISPEDMIKNRMVSDLNSFLYYDVNKQILDVSKEIVSDINTKFKNDLEETTNKLLESVSENEKAVGEILSDYIKKISLNEEYVSTKTLRQYKLDKDELLASFEHFKLTQDKTLEENFVKVHGKGTSIRGFKFRGAYETMEDARERAKYVRDNIEPNINAYVIPAGVWVPFDPNPDAIQDQEYMVEELNDIMGKYKENVEHRNAFFDKRKRELLEEGEKAKLEDIKKKYLE
jgi:hypothetical protein